LKNKVSHSRSFLRIMVHHLPSQQDTTATHFRQISPTCLQSLHFILKGPSASCKSLHVVRQEVLALLLL